MAESIGNFSDDFALMIFQTSLQSPNFADWNILDFDRLYVASLGGHGEQVQEIALELFPKLIAWVAEHPDYGASSDLLPSLDKLKNIFHLINYYRMVYPNVSRMETRAMIDNILYCEVMLEERETEDMVDIWQSSFCGIL